MLSSVRMVLSHTSHPGNIGAAARAMKTMGLSRLDLVAPQHFPHADATARASGADDVLAAAVVHDNIDAAISDCRLVIGASARSRSIPCPLIEPAECARLVRENHDGNSAILFGCERSGLSNDEIDRCHYLVQIPTDSAYSSLNLAAAVQIIAYELFMTARQDTAQDGAPDHLPVTAGEMERLYAHFEQTLVLLDFLDRSNPRMLMRRLRRLFNRARPDENEVNILRGVLTAAQKHVKQQV